MSKTKIPKDDNQKKSINNFLFVIFITGLVLIFFILPIIANIIFIDYITQFVIMGFVLIITILSGGVVFINYFSNKSSTPKEQPSTPKEQSGSVHNADYLINNLPDGTEEIKIWNETGSRAVAVLTKYGSTKGVAALYIPNNYAKKIRGKLEGKYELYFTIGKDWNYTKNKFERDRLYFKQKHLVDYSDMNQSHTILPANPKYQKSILTINKDQFPTIIQDEIQSIEFCRDVELSLSVFRNCIDGLTVGDQKTVNDELVKWSHQIGSGTEWMKGDKHEVVNKVAPLVEHECKRTDFSFYGISVYQCADESNNFWGDIKDSVVELVVDFDIQRPGHLGTSRFSVARVDDNKYYMVSKIFK